MAPLFKFENKRPKKSFGNILPIIVQIQKWTNKNQKFENPSTTHKFFVDLVKKRNFGPRDPMIGEVWVMGEGGLN